MEFALQTTDVVLVLVCLAVSIVSPAIGTSGGVTFAAMATVMPPAAVVPVHGFIEGVASAMRWTLLREFVHYRFVLLFTLGTVAGLVAGWPLIGLFPDDVLRMLLGTFFLFTAWAPLTWIRTSPALGGLSTSCLSVIVGATGPLVAALIARRERDHRVVIATQGACTVFQHFGKALLFSLWGFSFANYAGLIIAMIVVTIIGTYIGKRILLKSSQQTLRLALNAIVTVLGVQLLLEGLNVHLSNVPIGSWFGSVLILSALTVSCYYAYLLGASKVKEEGFKDALLELRKKCNEGCDDAPEFERVIENGCVGSKTTTSPTPTSSTRLLTSFKHGLRSDYVPSPYRLVTVGTCVAALTGVVIAFNLTGALYSREKILVTPTTTSATAFVPKMAHLDTLPLTSEAQPMIEAGSTQSKLTTTSFSLPSIPSAIDASRSNTSNDLSLLLERAQADLAALRLTTPPGNNAWDRFKAVLTLDPNNSAARNGLNDIVSRYLELAKRSTEAGEVGLAAIYLDRARTVIFGG